MPNALDRWARQVATLPAALVEATPEATRAGAEVLEREVLANVRSATGGDMRLSRVRSGKGAAIKLTVRQLGSGSTTAHAVVPTGPIMLVEADTGKHREPFTYTYNRRIKRRGRKPIHIPGVGVFARVNHPGTRGKRPVARAFTSAADAAGRAGVAVFASTARDHLAGS